MPDRLRRLIRDIPDFPHPGVLFKDITPLLGDREGLGTAVKLMAEPFRDSAVELVIGAESRGFIFGTAIALSLGCGFVPIRKPGKLPSATNGVDYQLEYGTDTLEMHTDAIAEGQRVLLVDDLLATGGTMAACVELVRATKAEILGAVFLLELSALNGRDRLKGIGIHSVITY